MQRTPHVVIVGAGFGGLNVARRLKHARANVSIIDRFNHHLFQPLLYQVATAGLSPADIATPIRGILRRQRNTEVLMGEVSGIDVAHRRVFMPDRSLLYDYLVIATGAAYNYFGHPEWERHAPPLKTVQDAVTLRGRILLGFESAEMEINPERRKAMLTFVVVGGGPTGVEMAGSIADLAHRALAADFRHIDPTQARVLLLEAAPRILPPFPEVLAAKARAKLESMGVEVRTGAMVEGIDDAGVTVAGERIPAKTVMWAAGTRASPAGGWLGADTDKAGRVKVNPDLSVPGHHDIYVIGDTAYVEGDQGRPLPGLAPVAIQQGRYVAARIDSRIAGVAQAPDERFRYKDKGNLATVGRAYALLQLGRFELAGFWAWVLWVIVHIFYLIGFRNRVVVIVEWAWAYLTFQRGARLIVNPQPRVPP